MACECGKVEALTKLVKRAYTEGLFHTDQSKDYRDQWAESASYGALKEIIGDEE